MATSTHSTRAQEKRSSDAAGSRNAARTRKPRRERLEARVDSETNAVIARAAAALNLSKSEFVVSAVAAEAQRVVARTDVTLMPAEMFDQMMSTLDVPDEDAAETLRTALRGVPSRPRRR